MWVRIGDEGGAKLTLDMETEPMTREKTRHEKCRTGSRTRNGLDMQGGGQDH